MAEGWGTIFSFGFRTYLHGELQRHSLHSSELGYGYKLGHYFFDIQYLEFVPINYIENFENAYE